MIAQHLPKPGEDVLVLVCGPKGMLEHISGPKAAKDAQGPLEGLLLKAGFKEEMVYKF
jgi:cytochrome-b5 reductase